MKKTAILLLLGIVMTCNLFAQKPNKEIITIDKQNLPGYSVQFPDLSADVLEGAIAAHLSKLGLKAGKSAGFTYYHNQNIPKMGTLNYDIYTKVVSEGKKKDNRSKLIFVVTKGNMNPVTEPEDQEIISKIIAFLEEFIPSAYAYNVEEKIATLEKDLTKQQKQLESTKKKRDKQQSKIEGLSKDITDKQSRIGKTQEDINKAKILLQQYKK